LSQSVPQAGLWRLVVAAGRLPRPSLENADGSDLTWRQTAEGAIFFLASGQGNHRLNYQKGEKRQTQLVELTSDRDLVIDPATP
jgi:hypothetical protein